jgi:DNA-binding IclR family transcriptional regulator
VKLALTPREKDALAALDYACWENSDEGGQGWVRPAAVAASLGRSLSCAYTLLNLLLKAGLVERRRFDAVLHYAPTEQGARVVLALESGEWES